jgi:hypothetical protein
MRIVEPTITLEAGVVGDLVVSCDLISGSSEYSLDGINPEAIVLCGPILGTNPEVKLRDEQGRRVARFSFHGARLAEYVQRGLLQHLRLSDTLTLEGLHPEGYPPLVGKATIAIERAGGGLATPCLKR